MLESLYLEFKKKVEKKYKVEIDSLSIQDKDGEVFIEFRPVTQTFSFDSKAVEKEETSENSESLEEE